MEGSLPHGDSGAQAPSIWWLHHPRVLQGPLRHPQPANGIRESVEDRSCGLAGSEARASLVGTSRALASSHSLNESFGGRKKGALG